MADSAAERQRRSRLHKAGDHSECRKGRCPAVTPGVTCDNKPVRTREDTLGKSGRALWDELAGDGQLSAVEAAILLEACRAVDRLERLDGILRGRDRVWLEIEWPDDGSQIGTVIVDKALSEARQQQVALKSLLAEFRQTARAIPQKPPAAKEASGVADFIAAAQRKRQSAG